VLLALKIYLQLSTLPGFFWKNACLPFVDAGRLALASHLDNRGHCVYSERNNAVSMIWMLFL
jgi:hypothetical protein